jgi:predicted NUDIX family NTP pyrophosphohydrolase
MKPVPKLSAGLLVVRDDPDEPRFLLVHPGGPFWKNKDEGAWSIPKGEYGDSEDPEDAAVREFVEELGTHPTGARVPLGSLKQAGGKVVTAWALLGDVDVANAVSNTFEIEWPPRSGQRQTFPEVDRAEFFTFADATVKILPSQQPFLQRALDALVTR